MIPRCNAPGPLKDSYLGPNLPSNLSRKYLSYSSNQAPAYVPDILISPYYLPNILTGAKVEDYVIKYPVNTALLDLLSDDIENHVEARIQSFLNQMMLTYRTGIQFILCTHAEIQVGEVKSRANPWGSYAAAHSGTLTTLRIANGRSDNTSTAFGKDSSFYHAWNMTVYLPTLVNQVDITLDSSTRYCTDSKNFRSKATEILNRVSNGTLSPRDGLRLFLQRMIEVLNQAASLERNEQTRKILLTYLKTAERYYENTDNGYPLLQKLFFRPITDTVNDLFYLTVQAGMQSQFKGEIQRLRPKEEIPATLPTGLNIQQLQTGIIQRLSTLLPKTPKSPGKKESVTEEYIKCCILSNTVEQLTKSYFNYLLNLSSHLQSFDLDKLTKIKTNKTISKIGLSAPALSLHQAVLEEIKKDPQKMPLILFSILAHFLVKMELSRTTNSPPPLSPRAREYLITLIENRIAKANIVLTQNLTAYAAKCSGENKVKTLAFTFFYELAVRNNEELIAAEIDKILSIKTEKTLPQNLPESIIALNREALTVIRSINPVKQEFTPQNMGLILCRALINTLK